MAGTSPTMTLAGARPVRPRGLLLLRGLVARVVRRIDVVDGERAPAVNLNHGRLRCPGVVLHVFFGAEETADAQGLAFLRVEFVPHADVERAGDHRVRLSTAWWCRPRPRRHATLSPSTANPNAGYPVAGRATGPTLAHLLQKSASPFILSVDRCCNKCDSFLSFFN